MRRFLDKEANGKSVKITGIHKPPKVQLNFTADDHSIDNVNALNLKQILNKDLNKTTSVKVKVQKENNIASIFKSHRKKKHKDPFKNYMTCGKKMMRRLESSQASRFKNRRNNLKLKIKDNFDELDKTKKQKKINFIAKNPRFYLNIKEKIKDSVKVLSSIKLGGRVNRNFCPNTTENKRSKDESLISLIRRKDHNADSRPLTAYNKQTREFRFNSTGRFPRTAYGGQHFKTKSAGLLKRRKLRFL